MLFFVILQVFSYSNEARIHVSQLVFVAMHDISDTFPYYNATVPNIHSAIDCKIPNILLNLTFTIHWER